MQSLQNAIIALGYIGIFGAVFAESGFLLGFFLPGDSLLFTIGLLSATQGTFNIILLIIGCAVFAVLGDSFGYYMGKRFGPSIFSRDGSKIFKKEYVERTQEFYKTHGKKTIILARFVPIVRTFAPIIAGIGTMEYKTFLTYNVIGGVVWTSGFLLLGFYLGKLVPAIGDYITFVALGIILLSLLPIAIKLKK